jgi:hypothetical protein
VAVVAPPRPTTRTDGDALAHATARLVVRFGHVADAEEIRALLDECHTRLRARASVTSYLVVLSERAVAAALAQRAVR